MAQQVTRLALSLCFGSVVLMLLLPAVAKSDRIILLATNQEDHTWSTAISVRPVGSITSTPSKVGLYSFLHLPHCTRACWRGLEPGVARLTDLKAYFREQNITPQVTSGLGTVDEDNAFFSWELATSPPHTFGHKSVAAATTWNGTVIQIIVPITPCISEVLSDFGQPKSVLSNEGEKTFYLLYPKLGLVFYITMYRSPFLGRVNAVFLLSEISFDAYTEESATQRLVKWGEISSQLLAPCR